MNIKDTLDDAIEHNRGQGHRYYAETIEVIRDRLRALEAHVTLASQPYRGIAWLIESHFEGAPPDYYCGPASWCSNPNHAFKFKTKEEADAVSAGMTTIGRRSVVEHDWS